jgi:putative PIG3 family NAD(P)H quinone oxidoreductase
MVNGTSDFFFDPGNFGFERGDARLQLLDRKRIEVLAAERDDRIVRTLGQEIFRIHASKVDPKRRGVNKSRAELTKRGTSVAKLPERMIAIDPEAAGGPEVLVAVERPVPQPGLGEYLIRVKAAGVNRPDVLQRKGHYPPPPGASSILGLEIAGTVVAVGEGADASMLAQPVCALVSGGGYAEYCAVPAGQCLPVPPAITMVEAAALPETIFTVWSNLFERAYAIEGDTVLVHGGTSGIGTMAILLGKLFDLTVIVTCGSDEKCARAIELGAAHAINYRTQDFVEEVKRITGGKGVQAVLDMVGGDYVARDLACLADDGRHVTIAVQGGVKAEINLVEIMRRRLTLTGSTLRARDVTFKALVADEIRRNVWPHVAEGRLKPVIDSVFPLAEAAKAHARMDGGDHVGKIVLEIA